MIRISPPWFKDEFDRTLLLRGVNLGGSSKVPFKPDGATYQFANFFDHRSVSFIGRPFPLDEADEHFARLKYWGFNILRFLVTWEAVEHSGPGIYDEAYLDYLHEVIKKANEYGLSVFIDPHEDVWSRFSGGDGAPGWTFEVLGMDLTKFTVTGAAITHQTHGDPFPRMIWPTNNSKFAAATLFTLFFAGNDLASKTRVEGVPSQDYLQYHYIQAMVKVAAKLSDLPNVIGFNTLNEPSNGYIGNLDLMKHFGDLQMGVSPTPWQSMQLAYGLPQKVDILDRTYFGVRKIGETWLNLEKESLWMPGYQDIWIENGVWAISHSQEAKLIEPSHFSHVANHQINFLEDYYLPFLVKFSKAIRNATPDAIIFIDNIPATTPPLIPPTALDNIAFADHWYDGLSLLFKRYSPFIGYDTLNSRIVFGPGAIHKAFRLALQHPKELAKTRLNDAPVLIGEIGIPYDMSRKKAFRTGNFTEQAKTFDRTMQALEANLLSYTLWNYTADNNNQHGDLWNNEDLSIFSRDQQKDPNDINSGGRALEAVVRPYPVCTAGEPLSLRFDYRTGAFEFTYNADPQLGHPTVFFVPLLHYFAGVNIVASSGQVKLDLQHQQASHFPIEPGPCTIRFSKIR